MPMTPQDDFEIDGNNPFEVGHKKGRGRDSVYTRFLRDTAKVSIKPKPKSSRGTQD